MNGAFAEEISAHGFASLEKLYANCTEIFFVIRFYVRSIVRYFIYEIEVSFVIILILDVFCTDLYRFLVSVFYSVCGM